jgi:hypothetical protein
LQIFPALPAATAARESHHSSGIGSPPACVPGAGNKTGPNWRWFWWVY